MKSNGKSILKKPLVLGLHKLVRFESREQIEYIEKAARQRGFSFVAFARLALLAAARQVIESPPDPLLESINAAPSSIEAD